MPCPVQRTVLLRDCPLPHWLYSLGWLHDGHMVTGQCQEAYRQSVELLSPPWWETAMVENPCEAGRVCAERTVWLSYIPRLPIPSASGPRTPGKVLAPLSLLAVSNQGPLRSPGQQSVVSFAVLHLRQGVNVGIWGSLE